MTEADEFDVLVIGGGPGGYTAAIRSAQLGFSVALVEAVELGGVCLNWGCIPSKSLLHSADLLREIGSASGFGITVGKLEFDLALMVERSRAVAARLSRGVQHLMRKHHIQVIEGRAALEDKNTVLVSGRRLVADNLILATGASPRRLPGLEMDGHRIWDARTAMTPPFQPERLLVIGAGAIGAEFASFYNTIGTRVTLVEALDQILPTEDAEIAGLVEQSFTRAGISVMKGTLISDPDLTGTEVSVTLAGERHAFDAVLVSIGVVANTADMGLEKVGVELTDGFIRTDGHSSTSVKGIYAIGDVAGAPCLAHKAAKEGVVAAETIGGLRVHPLVPTRIPACIYSHPQVASVGLTEAEAGGRRVRIGRFPLLANGKAVASNHTEGLIKTIFDAETGELLGAHLAGSGVTEMIQGFVLAMGLETTEADLIATVFPHPTISEAMHESVLSAYDRTINL